MIRLLETGDPCQAASFANVVASFSTEGVGISGIPQRAQAMAFLAARESRADLHS
jgi:hypothetical protein